MRTTPGDRRGFLMPERRIEDDLQRKRKRNVFRGLQGAIQSRARTGSRTEGPAVYDAHKMGSRGTGFHPGLPSVGPGEPAAYMDAYLETLELRAEIEHIPLKP